MPILFPDSADDADMAAACAFARKLAKPDHLVDDPEDAEANTTAKKRTARKA